MESPTPTEHRTHKPAYYFLLISDSGLRFTRNVFSPQLEMTAATYKSTAFKVLVLWNIPLLLLLAGVFQLGTSVIA